MEELAFKMLSMSITSSCVIVVVLLLRLAFKRLPKLYSYVLWGIVLFRLLCPVTVRSVISLIPANVQNVMDGGIYVTGNAPGPLQNIRLVWTVIWGVGMLVFFLIQLVPWFRLKQRLVTAVRLEDGIYETDQISGAFVMGIIRPRIYLESAIEGEERTCILKHEKIHLRRRDYLWKLIGFAALMLHWFNPLVWIALICMCKDMEMACDEQVVKEMGMDGREPYSRTLLRLSESHSGLLLPPAFGESNTKSRIRNILKYKKPRAWARGVAVLAIVVAAGTLMTNPVFRVMSFSIIGGADGPTSIFIAGKGGGSSPELMEKVITKNYQTKDEAPADISYEEYVDNFWWEGILVLEGTPVRLSDSGLYQATYRGYLVKRQE